MTCNYVFTCMYGIVPLIPWINKKKKIKKKKVRISNGEGRGELMLVEGNY